MYVLQFRNMKRSFNSNLKNMKNTNELVTANTSKKTSKKTASIVKTALGLEISANVNGAKLVKLLSPLQVAKKTLKIAVTQKRNGLFFNLKLIKDECKSEFSTYVHELETKFNVKISKVELIETISETNNFIPFLTESQMIKFNEKRLNFTPSLIIEAVSKYYKSNRIAPIKIGK